MATIGDAFERLDHTGEVARAQHHTTQPGGSVRQRACERIAGAGIAEPEQAGDRAGGLAVSDLLQQFDA